MTNASESLQVRFRPILDLTKNEAWIYRAVPVVVGPGSEVIGEDAVVPYEDDSADTAEINAKVISAAGDAYAAADAAGHDVLLMVPINANALSTTESATIIVEALRAIPRPLSKGLIAHVYDLPDNVTLDFLDDVVIPILFTTNKFVIEPPLTLEDYTDIAACNAQGVVLDLSREDRDYPDLTKVWSRARPRRLPIFIQNAADPAVIPMAERYQCRGLDGPLHGDLLTEIGPRLPGDNLRTKA